MLVDTIILILSTMDIMEQHIPSLSQQQFLNNKTKTVLILVFFPLG